MSYLNSCKRKLSNGKWYYIVEIIGKFVFLLSNFCSSNELMSKKNLLKVIKRRWKGFKGKAGKSPEDFHALRKIVKNWILHSISLLV